MNIIIVIISITTLLALIAFAVRLRKWIRSMRRDIYDIRDEVRAITRSNESMNESISTAISGTTAESVNAASINSLGFRFPVFLGGWSIDTFLGRYLIQHLLEHRPKCIVELGAGSSTIIIARTLQILSELNTVHIAVDHDEKYLGLTRDVAQLNSVAKDIEFILCPLVRNESLGKLWYDGLTERFAECKIDLLIIDGPPGQLQPLSRYPALPILAPFLAECCTVMLDDSSRHDEREIIKRWQNEFTGFTLDWISEGHGVAVLSRQ